MPRDYGSVCVCALAPNTFAHVEMQITCHLDDNNLQLQRHCGPLCGLSYTSSLSSLSIARLIGDLEWKCFFACFSVNVAAMKKPTQKHCELFSFKKVLFSCWHVETMPLACLLSFMHVWPLAFWASIK